MFCPPRAIPRLVRSRDLELEAGHPADASALLQQAAPVNLTDADPHVSLWVWPFRAPRNGRGGRETYGLRSISCARDYNQAVALAEIMRRFSGRCVGDAMV